MTAQSRVLSLPELLEHILCSLKDLKTLLRAQRVARQWHEIINRNAVIQRLVGLKPDPKREYWAIWRSPIMRFESARRIYAADIPGVASNELVLERSEPTHAMKLLGQARLGNSMESDYGTEYLFNWSRVQRYALDDISESSWRRMQCFQPPVVRLVACTMVNHLDSLMFRRIEGHRVQEVITDETGIKMAQVIGLLKTWHDMAPSNIDWNKEQFYLKVTGVVHVSPRGLVMS